MIRKVLIACGILAAGVYIVGDMVSAMRYDGYQILHQAISELSAIGAPTARLWEKIGFIYGLLVLAFGVGVWRAAGQSGALRIAGGLLVFSSVLGIGWYFSPMNVRGAETTVSDLLHLVMTAVTVPTLLLVTWSGSRALGRRFRTYSIATIAAVIGFGVPTGMAVQRVAAGLPTPWLGVYERVMVWGWMLWMAIFAIALLRRLGRSGERADEEAGDARDREPTTV